MDKNDLVIGISASGNSTNVLRAIDYANRNDGITFGLCGYDGGKLKRLSKKSLVINSMDMQKVEDLHMILIHCVMQYLNQNFTNE
jgi:D-sedoheptulose 7-phosphate isomerase